MEVEERVKGPVIRDKAFAKRLALACEGNPNCPTDQHRGKQKWVYDKLLSEFGIRVSPEGVRKWFVGESRPRPKVMSYLARLLEVDEAWLSLGIKPEILPVEKKRHNAMASGAVNLVAGIIQLAGGSITFPENESHILCILRGRSFRIDVLLPRSLGRDHYRTTIADPLDGKTVLAVIEEEHFGYQIINIPVDVIRAVGDKRGDFWELDFEQRGVNWRAGPLPLQQLSEISDLTVSATVSGAASP